MADPFESSRRKIARAKQHIQNFKRHVGRFEKKEPYKPLAELDPQSPNTRVHKVKLVEPLPVVLGEIVADAVGNLREALDLAGYAVAVASGSKTENTYFPFAKDRAHFNFGRCKDLPQDIQTLFGAFKPYLGGNDMLWAINQICNVKKHKDILRIGVTVIGGMNLSASGSKGTWAYPKTWAWDRTKNEVILGWSSTDSDFKCHFKVTLAVAFGEVQIVRGQEALGVLSQMVRIVEGILLAIEAESRRLGYIA